MSNTSALATMITVACLAGSVAGDDREARGRSSRPASEIVAKLRAEAARLETGHASDLFATMIDPDTVLGLKISSVQADLVGRLDKIARDVQRAWLIRGLDRQPAPPSAELAERLSEPGKRLRAGLVAHAEAITLEGVLEPNQANRLLRKIGRRPPKRLAGRYPTIYIPSDDRPPTDKGGFDFRLRGWVRLLTKPSVAVSELYKILLGQNEPDQGKGKTLELAKDQTELIRRLNEVERDVERDWLVRSLEGPDPVPREQWEDPPPPRMVLRMSEDGARLRASLVAHAEAIALGGVLEPGQAARAVRRLWSQSGLVTLSDPRMASSRGIMALLDPSVAASLRLSSSQREDLVTRLEARAALAYKLNGEIGGEKTDLLEASGRGEITEAQRVLMEDHLVNGARRQIWEAEQAVLGVLTSSQLRAFRRLLDDPDSRTPATKSKQAGRPG